MDRRFVGGWQLAGSRIAPSRSVSLAEGRGERYAETAADLPARRSSSPTGPSQGDIGHPDVPHSDLGAGRASATGGNITGLSMLSATRRKRSNFARGRPRSPTIRSMSLSHAVLESARFRRGRHAGLEVFARNPQAQISRPLRGIEATRTRLCLYRSSERQRFASTHARARLPTMHGYKESVEAGGLMSYGANLTDLFRRAGDYVDKILRGANPADLPVEQPTKFDLIVNLKTAKALALEVPATLLARADEVIE
jgi:putative ABC transport system substrate-binding protein